MLVERGKKMEYHLITQNQTLDQKEKRLTRQIIKNLHEQQKSLIRIGKEYQDEGKTLSFGMTMYHAGKIGMVIDDLIRLYNLESIEKIIGGYTPEFLSNNTLDEFPELRDE